MTYAPSRGELRFARATSPGLADPRLVLVLSVDGAGIAQVALVHPYPELACEVDAFVPRDVSGTPYHVVIETDLRAVVWVHQLGAAIGRLDENVIQEVQRVTTDRDVTGRNGIYCGFRLAGVVDPRWEFKSDEGDALRALAHNCTQAQLQP